jgi:hypothetical protein
MARKSNRVLWNLAVINREDLKNNEECCQREKDALKRDAGLERKGVKKSFV